MKTAEKILLLVSFLVAFIGLAGLLQNLTVYLILIFAAIYLFSGWYLLSPNQTGEKGKWLPFLIGYLIAQALVTVVFAVKIWPFGDTMAYVTMAMCLITIVSLLISRSSLRRDYPVDGYLARLVICLMFSGSPLWIG